MDLRLRSRLAILTFGALALGMTGCVADASDIDDEEVAAESEAIKGTAFLRSDQLSFDRAPHNTGDQSKGLSVDFTDPEHDAEKVIAWIEDHPKYENPIYLGNIHAWIYDTSHDYRVHIHTLASKIHSATGHPILFYFEEQNATHAPHPVSAAHGQALRTLAKSAMLLCATYTNGKQSHADVTATVKRWKKHYHDDLGVPMKSLLIDVDTSQTPSNFYYGTRGNLTNFNHVVKWTLDAAYDQGFKGFHTYGNVGGNFGTKRAADSTYEALDDAWDALVKAHPKQMFAGL
ncbi:MAG: hypothetical protein QM820_01690 [Minicystis sp.]